jgi:GTP-binding protein
LTALNSYLTSPPPTGRQLAYAHDFFTNPSHNPSFLFSTQHFRAFPPSSSAPEIAFLGRSNVGKSSLLNAVFSNSNKSGKPKDLAFVSSKPGRTRSLNVFGIGGGVSVKAKAGLSLGLLRAQGTDGKGNRKVVKGERDVEVRNWIGKEKGGLVVVDCPGYGFGSREEWGVEVIKYLRGRRQLRRVFMLVDAEHGVTKSDEQILEIMRQAGTPHQLLLSKVDKIVYPRAIPPSADALERYLARLQEIFKEVRVKVRIQGTRGGCALDDILCCSSEKSLDGHRKLGIDGLRWAILQATGLQCDVNGNRQSVDIDFVAADSKDRDIIRWSPG